MVCADILMGFPLRQTTASKAHLQRPQGQIWDATQPKFKAKGADAATAALVNGANPHETPHSLPLRCCRARSGKPGPRSSQSADADATCR